MTKLKQAARKKERAARGKQKIRRDNSRESQNIRRDLNEMDVRVTAALNKPAELNHYLQNEELMAYVDRSKVDILVGVMNRDVNRLALRLDKTRGTLNKMDSFSTPHEKMIATQLGLAYNDIMDDYVNTLDNTVNELGSILFDAAKEMEEVKKEEATNE